MNKYFQGKKALVEYSYPERYFYFSDLVVSDTDFERES